MANEIIWKKYPLNTNYECSNTGLIRNAKTQKILKPKLNHYGYHVVNMYQDGKQSTVFIHRVVLLSFNYIDNYQNYQVDHINGIRTDNRLENLKWVEGTRNILNMYNNQKKIYDLIQQAIQKFGYEETCQKISELLNTP